MKTRKILLLSAGVVAITALLAATNAVAQNQCNSKAISKNGSEVPGNFTVTVNEIVENGRRIYRYSVTSLTGANANKFFVWARQGLENEQGFTTRRVDNNQPGTYVTPHESSGGFPPREAWSVAHHEDGVVWTNIAIGHQFEINVKERFMPDTSQTTVLIGRGNSFEHCGPIFGPKNPAEQEFENSPLVSTTPRLCFDNGCCYFASVNLTTGEILSLEGDPATPFETNFPEGGDPQACVADNNADCAADLGVVFCGVATINSQPIQSEDGGTCYYPNNIKYPC